MLQDLFLFVEGSTTIKKAKLVAAPSGVLPNNAESTIFDVFGNARRVIINVDELDETDSSEQLVSTCYRVLEMLQKRALGIINKSPYLAHTNPLFKNCNVLKVKDFFQHNQLKFILNWYSTNRHMPIYLSPIYFRNL